MPGGRRKTDSPNGVAEVAESNGVVEAASPRAELRQAPGIEIGPLREDDVADADRIFRLAFGTFLGLDDPQSFHGGRDMVRLRWSTNPSAALVAKFEGKVVGSNVTTDWGSAGFFGPLTVTPEMWEKGVAQQLIATTMAIFERWKTRRRMLFTFANSPKHIALYQKFGFLPGYLTAIASCPVGARALPGGAARFSQLSAVEREQALAAVRRLCDKIYPGLDVSQEITSLGARSGDAILLERGDNLEGFAVCHFGPESEAASNTCYVKFAAVVGGVGAPKRLATLFDACESLAATYGASAMEAGVNTSRRGAYRALLDRGFRTTMLGLAMSQGEDPGYDRADAFVIDDLR